jgi:hypothetical protein
MMRLRLVVGRRVPDRLRDGLFESLWPHDISNLATGSARKGDEFDAKRWVYDQYLAAHPH